MIDVTIYKNSDLDSVGFYVSGHAGYANTGEDIVCSAVSALTITVCNSLEALCEEAFHMNSNQETGEIEYFFDETPGHDALLIMKVFEIGISDICNSYSDYICLTFKEV